MTGVIIDSQYNIALISNKLGVDIKAYTDAEVAKVVAGVIPYRMESDSGNLIGFLTLKTTGLVAILYQYQLRPAFVQFDTIISQNISTFIAQNTWVQDILI